MGVVSDHVLVELLPFWVHTRGLNKIQNFDDGVWPNNYIL